MTTETKTAHTPGPWEVFNGFEIKTEYGAPGMDISRLMPAVVTTGVNQKANARLIAAAPELLAACEAIVRYDNSGGREPFRETADLARDAITKATGEHAAAP